MVEERDELPRPVNSRSTYEKWIADEGIPIYEALAGTDDLAELPRENWARTGGPATFIQMLGPRQAERGLYVQEIPGGGMLEPEKHVYGEAIVVLKGRGITEVWQEGDSRKQTFEWGPFSIFAPPMNAWHRLINGSREPAIFLAVTTAPRTMNAIGDTDFIFNCDYKFSKIFDGSSGYFTPTEGRVKEGQWSTIWYTNFVPNAAGALLDDLEQKVAGGQLTGYRMAGGFPMGHISEWPVGRYHKAHYHGPGAILIGTTGRGYVNVWPSEIGTRPFKEGKADQVMEVNWGPRSIYSPPDGWFHQHMSTGAEPARHIAIYGGGSSSNMALRDRLNSRVEARYTPIQEGGTLLQYEDEDPEIRRRFEAALAKEGVTCTMPPVVYNP